MSWFPVSPGEGEAGVLSDARRQLHHAAQLATAFGISYVPPRADDSHTNLEWLSDAGAFASSAVGATRVVLRVADLTLLVHGDAFPLLGRSMTDAATWMRGPLGRAGLDPSRLTLRRHYDIPAHPVGGGAAFDASGSDLAELAAWYSNAAMLLERLRAADEQASEVRCWPHHFDIATLLTVGPGRSVGVGLEPGDVYYDEPYFYVNVRPAPRPEDLTVAPGGGGRWHTHEWIGAVLPASSLTGDASAQERQAEEFLTTAVRLAKGFATR